ncbi:MAG: hypothetical protein AAJB65_00190 [Candidatus Hodgkinia cicadicola]
MHAVTNKSLDYSFLALNLVAKGAEFEAPTKLTKLAGYMFCEVVRCFNLAPPAVRGWFFLLKTRNKFALVYCSKMIAVGSIALFCAYKDVGLSKVRINSVKCDGFLVTPYDLGLGTMHNRVLLSPVSGKFMLHNILGNMRLFRFDLVSFECTSLLSCVRAIGNGGVPLSASLSRLTGVRSFTLELMRVDAAWCVYRDSARLLRRFASVGVNMEGSVYDFIIYISKMCGVFVHRVLTCTQLRRSVLNERLFLFEGYVDLTNKTMAISNGRLSSVVGLLDANWAGDVNDLSCSFLIASNLRLKTSLVKRVLGLFVLDSSRFLYIFYRSMAFGIKFLFLDFATISGYNSLRKKFRLLSRIGINIVSVGAVFFLQLPAWRVSEKVVSVAEVWNLEFKHNNRANAKYGSKLAAHVNGAASIYFNGLMLTRRHLIRHGFIELKTSCLLPKQDLNVLDCAFVGALNCVPVYNTKAELFVRSSAVPSLASFFSKTCGSRGVCETGKLNVFDKSVNFLCALSDSVVFYHLFRIIFKKYFPTWPLVVESVNNNWQIIDLNLNAVCRCGKLFLKVLKPSRALFYFEFVCIENMQPIITIAEASSAVDVVVRFPVNFMICDFVCKLQRFVSSVCCVQLQSCVYFLSFTMVVLRLECFMLNLNMINSCYLVLKRFISACGGELVWKC